MTGAEATVARMRRLTWVLGVAALLLMPLLLAMESSPPVSERATAAGPQAIACLNPGHEDAVAFDNATNQVYAAPSVLSEGVLVLNATSSRVVGSIPLDDFPDAVAVDSATGDVYVAQGLGNQVVILNGMTHAVLGNVTVGAYPDAIAYDSTNGELYVLNFANMNLSVIDGATRSFVGNISLGAGSSPGSATAIAFDPWTNEVYALGGQPDNVTVIDPTNNSVVGSFPVGPGPGSLAIGDLGRRLFVSDLETGAVWAANASTGALVGTVAVGANGSSLALAADESNGDLYVGDGSVGTLTVINMSEDRVVGSLDLGPGSAQEMLAIDPGSGRLFVADPGANDVEVVNPRSDRPAANVSAPSTAATTFELLGLPPGTVEEVGVAPARTVCSTLYQSSTGPTFTFYLANGTYAYESLTPPNLTSSNASGTVDVAGSAQTVFITFRPPSTPPPQFLGYPVLEGYAILAVGLGASAALVVEAITYLRPRGPRRPPARPSRAGPPG